MYFDTRLKKFASLGGPTMKRALVSFIIASLLMISVGYVYGHHSFAATYAEEKHAIEGKLRLRANAPVTVGGGPEEILAPAD
jgi:hypothetical protein